MKTRAISRILTAIGATVVAVSVNCNALAESDKDAHATSFSEAFGKGKAHLTFRYRYETVDEAAFSEKAGASTLQTRFGFESGEYRDWKLGIEFNNVTAIGNEQYNSTRNGLRQYPVVADPEGTIVNNLFIDYSPGKSSFILGRQNINRDNQRFIGAVAWRQNDQTFDAITAGTGALSDWQLDYGYLWQVNRIFGPEAGTPSATFDSDSHLFNVQYKGFGFGTLGAYAYLLDLENNPGNSNSSYGLRLTGKYDLARDRSIQYEAEYATQSDYADNPVDYSADYHLLQASARFDRFSVKAGWEVLGGDNQAEGKAFRTPLATLHKFQGWADRFLNTPSAGVDDRYLAATATFFDATAAVIYHDFQAASGGRSYGDEWDFSLTRAFAKKHTFLLKYANYNADGFSVDTKKWWLQYLLKI